MSPLILALASLAFSASTGTFQKEVVAVSTRSITLEYRLTRIAPRLPKNKFRMRADSKRTTLKKAIEENRQWELYALEGLTTKELWQEMVDPGEGRGPVNSKTGQRMAALTDLNCRWKADFSPSRWEGTQRAPLPGGQGPLKPPVSEIRDPLSAGGTLGLRGVGPEGRRARTRDRWRIANVYLSIQHTIVFPEATKPLLAEDQQSWDKFTKALSRHELGHVEINRKHLQRFVILSHKITAASSDELERTAQGTFEEILADLNEENERYDRETNHGETQGAVLTWTQ